MYFVDIDCLEPHQLQQQRIRNGFRVESEMFVGDSAEASVEDGRLLPFRYQSQDVIDDLARCLSRAELNIRALLQAFENDVRRSRTLQRGKQEAFDFRSRTANACEKTTT